jgi:hypothetical protein
MTTIYFVGVFMVYDLPTYLPTFLPTYNKCFQDSYMMTHNTYYIMIFFRRNRHACGQITKGSGNNYGQNFSTSCVSQTSSGGIDNSETVMQAVDAYTLTKPSKAACPNRYMSAVAYPAPTMAPTMPVSPVAPPTSSAQSSSSPLLLIASIVALAMLL